MKRNILFLLFFFCSFNVAFSAGKNNRQPICRGTVSCAGKGLEGVLVTDGINFCKTDRNGNYSLQPDLAASFIYITSPSGYNVPVENSVPKFYRRLDAAGHSARIDFQLVKSMVDDTRHGFIAWADPQVKAAGEVPLFRQAVCDLGNLLKSFKDVPFHALGCGDITGDNPALFDSTKMLLSATGIPFYQSIGNHDMKYYGRSDETSTVNFEKHFGPTYYSFNKGKVHYVVLDDVFYIGRDYFYIGYLPERQLAWLEKDLSFVPAGSTVVVTFHIPSALDEKDLKTFNYDNIAGSITNKKALYDLLKPYHAHLISGHLHYSRNMLISPTIYEHILSSVCGAWWMGNLAEDGTPQGYGVFEVNGDSISWYFKSLGKDASYQFRAYPVGSNPEQPDYITVNVWNWDPEWKVFWYENGRKMGEMEAFSGVDPQTAKAFSDKSKMTYPWIQARKTDHLFRAKPQATSAEIRIEVVDRFKNIYRSNL